MSTELVLSEEVIDKGKPFALLAYASVFTGWPLFVLPMLQRDNAYALQHAKWAGSLYVAYLATFMVIFALAFITCGFGAILVFLLFLWWVPAGMGFLSVLNGELKEPLLAEPLATTLFKSLEVKEED